MRRVQHHNDLQLAAAVPRSSGVLFRRYMRRALISLDNVLKIREWLRKGDGSDYQDEIQPTYSDPFSSSEIKHPQPNSILDIGGCYGQFARKAFLAYPDAKIYSFEPIPECYEALEALKAEIPNLYPIKIALSDFDGERDFWVSRFRDSSSLHEMLSEHIETWPFTEIELKIEVETARLDGLASALSLRPPIFAKIDVQGHELAVIKGGRETLSRCQRVMLECNFVQLYRGQPSFTSLYDEMKSLGFLFECFIGPLRHPRTLELLSADMLFYKI